MKLFSQLSPRYVSTEPDFQKMNEWREYCGLELIPNEKSDRSVNKVRSILTLLENLWQKAIAVRTKESELKIWQKQERHGQIHWHAYDPWKRKSVSFASELEMLSWIENLYSRSRW